MTSAVDQPPVVPSSLIIIALIPVCALGRLRWFTPCTSSFPPTMFIALTVSEPESELVSIIFGWWLVVFPLLCLDGFVLRCLWRWFVSDVFGVQELKLAQAIGIRILIGFLFPGLLYSASREDKEKQHSLFLDIMFGPVSHLCTGWIVHQFQ